jgi:glycosyltransferase involved in cell wall biosynthesis
MHENQLTYPLPEDGATGPMRRQLGERDRHYAFINLVSMLAADRVFFNSGFHRDSFLEELAPFLRHYPEYKELNSVARLSAKTRVLPVGIDLRRLDGAQPNPQPGEPPLIIWNQRWEYDKGPDDFAEAMRQLAVRGVEFRLALCGQQFGRQPASLVTLQQELGDRIIYAGMAPPERYRDLLWQADITVSTAQHEFFGVSVVEAIYARTFPLLPHRLSYPEIIPPEFHEQCLYRDPAHLVERLCHAVSDVEETRSIAARLAPVMQAYDWQSLAAKYDQALEDCVASRAFVSRTL